MISGKRGQLTIFIIVGIVILSAIAFLLFFISSASIETGNQKTENFETIEAEEYITTCLNLKLEESIKMVSAQGGYYIRKNDSIYYGLNDNFKPINIPYYFYSGILSVPSTKEVASQISFALADDYKDCFNLSNFSGLLRISLGELEANSFIIKDKVSAKVKVPLVIKKGNLTKTIEDFDLTVNSDIYELHSLSQEITDIQSKNNGLVCVGCLSELESMYDVDIEYDSVEHDFAYTSLIYHLNTSELVFSFAHKLRTPTTNNPLVTLIEDIPDQEAITGYEFNYQMGHSDEVVGFELDNSMLSVNDEGMLSFTPMFEDVGNYLIKVTAFTSDGMKDERLFVLNVVSPSDLTLERIGFKNAFVGEEFILQLNASNEAIFTDYTDMFDMTSDGFIRFTPTVDDVGEYEILIEVTDTKGGIASDLLYLTVLEGQDE